MEGFMKITKEEIEKLGPCPDGLKWGIENCKGMSNLENILIKLNDHRPDWSRWLFTHLMTRKQCVELAVFSAEQVLRIYENKYQGDNRPRKAIESAKEWLTNPTADAADAAYAADDAAASAVAYASAAYAAASAAYAAAYAAASAASAAYAAYAAYASAAYASAANAADYAGAAYAAYAASAASAERLKLQRKIIRQAVRILERNL
jgi:hypothetical protein